MGCAKKKNQSIYKPKHLYANQFNQIQLIYKITKFDLLVNFYTVVKFDFFIYTTKEYKIIASIYNVALFHYNILIIFYNCIIAAL